MATNGRQYSISFDSTRGIAESITNGHVRTFASSVRGGKLEGTKIRIYPSYLVLEQEDENFLSTVNLTWSGIDGAQVTSSPTATTRPNIWLSYSFAYVFHHVIPTGPFSLNGRAVYKPVDKTLFIYSDMQSLTTARIGVFDRDGVAPGVTFTGSSKFVSFIADFRIDENEFSFYSK